MVEVVEVEVDMMMDIDIDIDIYRWSVLSQPRRQLDGSADADAGWFDRCFNKEQTRVLYCLG